MPGQLDLLGYSGLALKPYGNRSQPRLWVRRLVIWREPGVILRELSLRAGLNIIWSPDPADLPEVSDGDKAVGHGSGKTLLCRLLRYCLGEDRFATDELRYRIAKAFPDGKVGAEVVVDGVRWAIVRPIGMGRQHFANRDADLDRVVLGELPATGMAPFLEAVESSVLSDEVAALMPGGHAPHAWLIALAWLSRDQECRFDKVLDWRSADSDSGSPARGLSATKTLDALRALLGAINPTEFQLRAEIDEIEHQRDELAQEAIQRDREANRLRSALIDALNLHPDDIPPGLLGMEALRRAAKANLAKSAIVDQAIDVTDLDDLRAQANAAGELVKHLERDLAVVEARIPEIESILRRIKAELPGASAAVDRSANPVCPVCEVPIDWAIAEGCKLSHKLPNLVEVRNEMERLKQDMKQEGERLQANNNEKRRITQDLDPARKRASMLRNQLQAAENARDARSDAWVSARQALHDVARLERLLLEEEEARAHAAALEDKITARRDHAGALRDAQASVFSRLSHFFDAIIREMMGPDATGKVVLDGNGLKLSVELGGERSTSAIDSLKVIALDLSAMCMSVEGGTHLPAFLIHDSPREADLGLSVYQRLFHLIRRLEDRGGQSQFQYIVTTTTRPPEVLRTSPWLCETLGGSGESRLLRRDL